MPCIKTQNGFTLMEVLVSLVIAGTVLLGLGLAQVKSLQYSNNSFNYTLALIHANNSAEAVWPDICSFQKKEPNLSKDKGKDKDEQNAWLDQNIESTLGLKTITANATDVNQVMFTVSWYDSKLKDFGDEQDTDAVKLSSSYPNMVDFC